MATEIKVPPLGESVTSATIARWLKKSGDTVALDEPLVELETDKVSVEVPAPAAGMLSEILAQEGAEVAVGALLGMVTTAAGVVAAPPSKPVQQSRPAANPSAGVNPPPSPSGPVARPSSLPQPRHSPLPAAAKMMSEQGVEAERIGVGTGKDGRITKGDVLEFLSRPVASPVVASAVKAGRVLEAREERVKMTRLRRTIAARLKEAQNTAAMLTTFNEVDMSAVIALRTSYKDAFEKKHGGIRLGFMSIFVKASIAALKEFPAVNAEVDGDDIVYKHFVHMGIAVGGANGLVVPVVRDADQMSVAQLEKAISDFGRRARDGQLKLDELTGGTFSITNGGVYGSLMSTPILNPPQSAILGMHKIQDRPIAIGGRVEIRPMMYLALSYDHRIVDGKEAVSFLVRVKEGVEDPRRLLLDLLTVTDAFDLIVIGSGPGGYVCAIRAAQLGMKVACVEPRATLGGTCLNIGCIPSKALLQSSENFHATLHAWKDHGIDVREVKLDLARMQARKSEVVGANVKGVEFLFKKNKVTWLKGMGRITAPGKVKVAGLEYTAKHIVIATGSESMPLPGVDVDEKRVVTSTGALELAVVPRHLVVIGGGVIGLELGSVWRRLGARVTVVEFLDRLIPGNDGEIAKAFQRILAKQGIEFRLSTKVTGAVKEVDGITLTLEPVTGGPPGQIKADVVLLAIGRRAYTDGLGLAEIGVATDERGRVETDGHFATNVAGIYAIGDVIAGPMLAHKAEDEGVAVAELLAGQAGHVNYEVIPSVVYTWPEVASLGQTEEQLKAAGIAYNVGKFPFTANGRARALGETDGFVKILVDKVSDRILGAHIIGPDAGTLIAELATAMEFGASAEDVARICHAHPTLSEAVKEAALAADGRALHI